MGGGPARTFRRSPYPWQVTEALRQQAANIFLAGVAAADPVAATASALGELDPRVAAGGRVAVLAVGKAALGMAKAAVQVLGGRLRSSDVLLVTHDEAVGPTRLEALRSGHPLPDERGFAAAREFERRAAALGGDDLALVLISGGASALLPAPAPGVPLEDKLEVTRLLPARRRHDPRAERGAKAHFDDQGWRTSAPVAARAGDYPRSLGRDRR